MMVRMTRKNNRVTNPTRLLHIKNQDCRTTSWFGQCMVKPPTIAGVRGLGISAISTGGVGKPVNSSHAAMAPLEALGEHDGR